MAAKKDTQRAEGASKRNKDLPEAVRGRADELERQVQVRTRSLQERMNELNCLYAISDILNKQRFSMEEPAETLERIIHLLPSGWQYPEITSVRLSLPDKEIRTENFSETRWKQSSPVVLHGTRAGTLEVFYLEEKPSCDEGPFLREERRLIDSIALQLGEFLEVKETQEHLIGQARILEAFFTATITPLVLLDKDFNFIRVNSAYARACGRDITDLIGRNHFDLYPSGAKKIFEEVVRTKKPHQVSAGPFTFPDHPEWGVTYWDWTLTPVLDSKGEVDFLVYSLNDVTGRTRAQKAVEAEQRRFNDVLERLPAYLVLLRPDYHVAFANRFFRERFGESHGRRCFEYLFGRSEPCQPCETYTVLNTMAPHEWDWKGPDGRDYHVFDFPFTDTDGSLLVLEMGMDVTDRRRAEEALRASILYTRSLIEASLDPLVMISPDGKITDVNRATEVVTGVPRERLIGSDFSDFFTGPEKAREGYEQVFARGSVKDYPLAIRHASGRVTDVLYNATVYRNEAGEVQGVFAAARDITERKQAEQSLLRLATAVEQTSEAVAITDLDGRISYVNPAFVKTHGLNREKVLGQRYDDLLRAETEGEEFREALVETLRRGQTWRSHLVRKGDGGTLEFDLTTSPVKEEGGAIINYVSIERDVTEEIRLQQQLRQMQKMEALGTLAGGIAHDFNNILMPIAINTELALLDAAKGSLLSNYLQLVLDAANRGKELVKQIITFSRQKEQERKPMDVAPLVKEALRFFRASIPKNIAILERIEATSSIVPTDPTLIHQILMNLCSNAAYAMREQGGELEVRLRNVEFDSKTAGEHVELRPGPYLQLTVSDTGHGMEKDVIERAFDPFFTTKKPGEGTGMGLALVHGIVKSHKGMVTVESEKGKGATFHIYLPRATAKPEADATAPKPILRGSERILFIDDEAVQVQTVQYMLERLGYRVTGQSNAMEALRIFRSQPDAFDLVITDQTMPHITGDKLAREFLALRPDLPVLLCTGFSEVIDEEGARAIGIKGFLMKPYAVGEISEKIRRALKK
jgi:PAS domain S-box-containing protein